MLRLVQSLYMKSVVEVTTRVLGAITANGEVTKIVSNCPWMHHG